MIWIFHNKLTTKAKGRFDPLIPPADVRAQFPQIPWNEIGGMRDKLIHEYFGVDLEIVWETIQCDLTELEEGIHHME